MSLAKRAELMFSIRELVHAAPRGHRPDPDRRARQGALRRARRGRARPRGDRVRVRHPDPASRAASRSRRRPGSTSTRSGSRSASSPASRRSTSPRWCPMWMWAPGARLRQLLRPQALREGSERVAPRRASCSRRPASRTASSPSSTATRSPSSGCSSIPTSPPSASSARRRSRGYIYETGTKNGKRVQALGGAKNHMVVLPDADIDMAADAAVSAAYGSAGERCMAVSVVVAVGDVADPLVGAIKERLPKVKVGPGPRARLGDGPADHARAPRQGRLLHRQGPRPGRHRRRRRP